MLALALLLTPSTHPDTLSSCSLHGLKDVDRFLFVNERCVEEYGEPRSPEECSRLLSLMSEEAQETRRTWLTKAAMVKHSCVSKLMCLTQPVRTLLTDISLSKYAVHLRRVRKGTKHGSAAASC